MNTAIVIIGLAMLIFVIVFSLKRAKEKRKAWEAEREKIKEYGEKIKQEVLKQSYKELKKGDNIVLAAFGGGFTWGSVYLKWAY